MIQTIEPEMTYFRYDDEFEDAEENESSISWWLIKWGISAFVIVYYLAKIINTEAFSFNRIYFSFGMTLWVRIVLIGLICDFVSVFRYFWNSVGIGEFGRIFHSLAITSKRSLIWLCLAFAVGLLTARGGIMMTLAGLILSIYQTNIELCGNRSKHTWLVGIEIVIACLVASMLFKVMCTDILRITASLFGL